MHAPAATSPPDPRRWRGRCRPFVRTCAQAPVAIGIRYIFAMRTAISVSGTTGPDGDPTVGRWLTRTLAADPPRAKSLIVTVWGDALAPHGGTLWLGGLIGLMGTLGVRERSVRTNVYRLAADGWLRGQARGRQSRYRLTAAGAREFASAYRRIYFPHADDWDGRWQLVVAAAESLPAAQRALLRDALAWGGFGALLPGVFARPRSAQRTAIRVPAQMLSRLAVLDAREHPRQQ